MRMAEHGTSRVFLKIAQCTAQQCGRASTFIVACIVIIVWGAGPVFDYSDTWQLIINTGTTIVTFLMVFPMQNTQNRDTVSIQLKLDELIRANENATQRNAVAGRSHRGTAEARQGYLCDSRRHGGACIARACTS
jgi:low affinity Fe/Cu permease